MVSTDKGRQPNQCDGRHQAVAELIVQETGQTSPMSTCSVRSAMCAWKARGSVVPLFRAADRVWRSITVTDPRMKRYFMTIPEAAGLIIEAELLATGAWSIMLDMGEPFGSWIWRTDDRAQGVAARIEYCDRILRLASWSKVFEELALDFEQARTTSIRRFASWSS